MRRAVEKFELEDERSFPHSGCAGVGRLPRFRKERERMGHPALSFILTSYLTSQIMIEERNHELMAVAEG